LARHREANSPVALIERKQSKRKATRRQRLLGDIAILLEFMVLLRNLEPASKSSSYPLFIGRKRTS